MTIRAINPTTGETINTYTEMALAMVAHTIAQAHDAFLGWRNRLSIAGQAPADAPACQAPPAVRLPYMPCSWRRRWVNWSKTDGRKWRSVPLVL